MMAHIHYKELGLVNTRKMFQLAMAGLYAVPAYNFNNLEQLEAIVLGCIQSKSPVILQCSGSARKYMHEAMVPHLVKGAVEMMKDLGANIPIALHLDHGDTLELGQSCINSALSSVMIDGSHHPFEENIRLTRQVVSYAHERDVTVEGELGVLAGIEDEVSAAASCYTQPHEVEEFVQWTGLNSLAISIGTSHGAFKFKVKPGEEPPPLRFDILEEIERVRRLHKTFRRQRVDHALRIVDIHLTAVLLDVQFSRLGHCWVCMRWIGMALRYSAIRPESSRERPNVLK